MNHQTEMEVERGNGKDEMYLVQYQTKVLITMHGYQDMKATVQVCYISLT